MVCTGSSGCSIWHIFTQCLQATQAMTKSTVWWKDATIYQIWPASYKDSNGDGFGDIPGIISTLDYLDNLGVDIIWVSPIYDSPQDDMGYDVSDYESVYAKYGTMGDMEKLIQEVHARGMRIILDVVINHTSTAHKWFQESRSSKTNPKRNWYIWKPPRYDADGKRHPPNNWNTYFFESAWEYDALTEEYYLHLFAKSQADLNWENEETRNALYESALRFWLDKGIDGFRLDTAGIYSKVQTFEDAPIVFPDQEFQPCRQFHESGPRIHEFHKEMRQKVFTNYDVVIVGEVGYSNKENAVKYVSAKEKEMDMMFLFDVVDLGVDPRDRYNFKGWNLVDLKDSVKNMSLFAEGTDAWSTCFLENHDQGRAISRFGNDNDEFRVKSGKMLATMLISLSGTLFLYQGQEIGMTNVPKNWNINEYLDVCSQNYYKQCQNTHGNKGLGNMMRNMRLLARDNARTPVQWNSLPNAGFTSGTPWMRVNENYRKVNVASQRRDPDSLLNFYRDALKIRKAHKDLFIYGSLEVLDHDNDKVFSFFKEKDGKKAYVVLNFSNEVVNFDIQMEERLELILTNTKYNIVGKLFPYESRVYIVHA
ncbi:hypothetical protein HF325_005084 [Metschnikowia pulcherrima]|uniref:Glycosyl hydrolase family 13 catalytic domain-containing protein n=1 Tax=Metschnikowia pulcherrima TaxID=27326 RepID=A0A8H7GMD6_9ASCO|nr:hypothetical protein HF325_005084 [Metschnikowia pulcherrima]